jgi:RHS repeat-associated protein
MVTSSNQVSGFCYDASGNLLGEGSCPSSAPYTYNYNAENQLTSTAGVTYTYDGDGDRVEKSSGEIYWYTSDGEVLDETDLSGNPTSEYVFFAGARIARRDASGNVFYYLADHLDSSRVIAEIPSGQSTATLCYDADFYPFGGERAYTNTCSQNYKFTGKERDPESGLDNFEARYYGSSVGRFMSPDDPFVGWNLADPQSLNLYSYVQDNPINDVDPTGHLMEGGCPGTGFGHGGVSCFEEDPGGPGGTSFRFDTDGNKSLTCTDLCVEGHEFRMGTTQPIAQNPHPAPPPPPPRAAIPELRRRAVFHHCLASRIRRDPSAALPHAMRSAS